MKQSMMNSYLQDFNSNPLKPHKIYFTGRHSMLVGEMVFGKQTILPKRRQF